MSNKKSQSSTPLPKSEPPIIYADQPAEVQVGPYVSKFTLGVSDDDESDFPRHVVTIAMPTVNLIRMVEDLQELFADPGFKKRSKDLLDRDAKMYFGATKLALPDPHRPAAKRVAKAIAGK